jgi:3,4-dihydroxy 2-butanone 4-phosphate synthase/GTP cyclohydrolase II
MTQNYTFISPVEIAIEDIKNGKMVIIVDDEDRENEGDLAMAAELVTPDAINFMSVEGRGLICTPLTEQRLNSLKLPMMVKDNTARHETAFTVSVDVLDGASTGISAHDRSATIRALVSDKTKPEDLARPGHVFPLQYMDGGVLVRAGQTEAIIDLAKLANMKPAGIICEIIDSDGSMARLPKLKEFAEKHKLNLVSVADIIAYRRLNEKLVERVAEARLPTVYGDFTAISYKSTVDSDEHIALVKGKPTPDKPTLVRVHSECLTGDVFGSTRCDCGQQAALALQTINKAGSGIFLYMRQEGRGIGIHNKLKAYNLQDTGLDTVDANLSLGFPADLRHYGVGAQILVELGVQKLKLMTNNPKKVIGLESYGLELSERIPINIEPNEQNRKYLETKRVKLGHIIAPMEKSKRDK